MVGCVYDAARRQARRILALAGVGLTLAVGALPAQAAGNQGNHAGGNGNGNGGSSTGHKVG
jgi:hypothetical protein